MKKEEDKIILRLDDEFGEIKEVNIDDELSAFSTTWIYINPECPTGGGYYST